MTFRIAHLSDVHLGPLPHAPLSSLASKRILGYINWHRNRGRSFGKRTTELLVADLKETAPDHIVVTGDLVNIALDEEFRNARAFLDQLGNSADVTVIPGNHDAYVPGARARFDAACAPFLASDDDLHDQRYPVLRRRGPVLIVGLSSAIATAPFMATGKVDDRQRAALRDALTPGSSDFRLVLVHHPPFEHATHWHKRLINDQALRDDIAEAGAELILHGHTHLPTQTTINGRDGSVPVFGVASAAQAPGGHKPPASYTLFEVQQTVEGWHLGYKRRGFSPSTDEIVELESGSIALPRPAAAQASG